MEIFSKLGARAKQFLSAEQVEIDIATTECSKWCAFQCDNFRKHEFAIDVIISWRKPYHSLQQGPKQQNYLTEVVTKTRLKTDTKIKCHDVEGFRLCRRFFYRAVMGVSENTYKRAVTRAIYNAYLPGEKRKGPRSNSVNAAVAKAHMKSYVQRHGEFHPENGKIVLPGCTKIIDIFKEYELATPNDEKISKNRFYSIWSNHFSKTVTFARHASGVVKCDFCIAAERLIARERDDRIRQHLIKDRKVHLDLQSQERESYYSRRADAEKYPQRYISIIIDGMDQSKLSLPHYKGWQRPKCARMQLKSHITGTIVHGVGTIHYIDLLQYPHDSNLTLTCLIDALFDAKDTLPPTLYVQMDNCARENKNVYVLGCMSSLIKLGITTEVFLNFLIKGHTHEDIDQRFSHVSKTLKRFDAKTLMDMKEQVQSSMPNSQLEAKIIGRVYNIKDWLSPVIEPLHNHSYPHRFWLYRDETSGDVLLKYKHFTGDQEWLPRSDENPLSVLKRDTNGNQLTPKGIPRVVDPKFNTAEWKPLKKSIDDQKHLLGFENYEWWQKFLDNPCDVLEDLSSPMPWKLSETRPRQQYTPDQQRPEPEILVTPLTELNRKERIRPSIYTGRFVAQTNSQLAEGSMIVFTSAKSAHRRIGEVKEIQQESVIIWVARGKATAVERIWKKSEKTITIRKDSVLEIFSLTPKGRLPNSIQQMLLER